MIPVVLAIGDQIVEAYSRIGKVSSSLSSHASRSAIGLVKLLYRLFTSFGCFFNCLFCPLLSAATQLWRYRIADIAKDYKQIVFAVADDDSNEDLLKNFGLADTGVDMNIGILDSGKKYVMGDMDEFDGDHVRQFLDSFGRGT